jgi:hypothetical protein
LVAELLEAYMLEEFEGIPHCKSSPEEGGFICNSRPSHVIIGEWQNMHYATRMAM